MTVATNIILILKTKFMKKKINYLLFMVCCILTLSGCSKDEALFETDETLSNVPGSELFTFVYQGITYSSEFIETEDGNIILMDEDINELRQSLISLPELATIQNYDGSLEYIENQELAMKRLEEGTLFKESEFTRVTVYELSSSTLEVYANTKHRDLIGRYNGRVSVSLYKPTPMMGYWCLASFKFSGTYEAIVDPRYPGKIRATAIFFKGTNYDGQSFWHAIDRKKTENNSSSTPFSAQSFRVEWT